MRKPIIAGNWKMNMTVNESIEFIEKIKDYGNDNVEGVVCVPFTSLLTVKEKLSGSKIKLGAQNIHWEESGAFTGEISGKMLKEIGVDYVIIGHSERRKYFGETDETVNLRLKKALEYKITPIICVGESLEERESGIEKEVVKKQVTKGLKDISADRLEEIVVAYEPIWAIGTGKTATSDQAQEIIGYIREVLKDIFEANANTVRIQYGGSVKGSNIKELMNKEDIDGALVGGASLIEDEFKQLLSF